jgi:flagellar motor protein MotB
MKHTMTMAALLCAAACVSPEAHRQVVGANTALQAEIAGMADAQKALSAENARLRDENRDLSSRAADAAWIADQKQKLAGLLEKYGTGTPAAAGGVELVKTREGYAFRVAGGVLFSPGSNTLTEQGQRTLQELAAQLQGRRVRVEGHTDDQPIQRSQWGTNLRLSAERALVVADFLTDKAGLKAADVSIAGYSQYRPAIEGNDDAARQKNRRVEILMLDT